MPVKETHAVLQKLPISELGAALAVAIIDNAHDREPVSAAYGLIATAQAMAEHLSSVDRMLVALLHRAAIDLLPKPRRGRPMMRGQNGVWIELVK